MKKDSSIFRLCLHCKKIYNSTKFNKLSDFIIFIPLLVIIGVLLIFSIRWGLVKLGAHNSFETQMVSQSIAIFITIFVFFSLYKKFVINKNERNCPVCKSNKALIKVDTPEAIDMIKKYDLSFPPDSDTPDTSKNLKQPWEK